MIEIPEEVDDCEIILRTLYSPYHIKRGTDKVRPSAVQPPNSPDEEDGSKRSNKVSVTRKDYVDMQFCVNHALSYESEGKLFEGFLKLKVKSVRDADADVRSFPTNDNPAHANIVYKSLNVCLGDDIDNINSQKLKQIQRKIVEEGFFIKREDV